MKRFLFFLQTDHGPQLRKAAGLVAVAVAATYAAGYWCGDQLHRLNDQLAGIQPAPQMILQRQSAITVRRSSPAIARPDLSTLRVIELRQLARSAGHRTLARSGRRADLLAALTLPDPAA